MQLIKKDDDSKRTPSLYINHSMRTLPCWAKYNKTASFIHSFFRARFKFYTSFFLSPKTQLVPQLNEPIPPTRRHLWRGNRMPLRIHTRPLMRFQTSHYLGALPIPHKQLPVAIARDNISRIVWGAHLTGVPCGSVSFERFLSVLFDPVVGWVGHNLIVGALAEPPRAVGGEGSCWDGVHCGVGDVFDLYGDAEFPDANAFIICKWKIIIAN